jgi:hypothetical protein
MTLTRASMGLVLLCRLIANFSRPLSLLLFPHISLFISLTSPLQGSLSLSVNVSLRYSQISLRMNDAACPHRCKTFLGALTPNAWTVTVDGCNHIFKFNMNWTHATQFCGIRQVPSTQPGFVHMKGMFVSILSCVFPFPSGHSFVYRNLLLCMCTLLWHSNR